MDHLALAVRDRERSRRFSHRAPVIPSLRPRARLTGGVHAFRDRLDADGVEIVGTWDEFDYASVKFRDPDSYVVEVAR